VLLPKNAASYNRERTSFTGNTPASQSSNQKNLAAGEQAVVNDAIGLWRNSAPRGMVETNTTTRVGFFLMDSQEQGGQHESRA